MARAKSVCASFRADGADPFIGRRTAQLLRDAGLTHVGVEARVDLCPLDRAAREYLNPHALVLSGVYFLSWGRKPAI